MDSPKTHCPECNSLQDFKVKLRNVDRDHVERYIRCKMCRSEFVLDCLSLKESLERRREVIRRARLAKMPSR